MRLAATVAVSVALLSCTAVGAKENARLTRIDANTVELMRTDTTTAAIWLSHDTVLDKGDAKIRSKSSADRIRIALPSNQRGYAIIRDRKGRTTVVGERLLPLEQGSNFRDIGGYLTRDGRTVRWGKVFRSGAMPLLSDADYALIGQLGLDSVVDLRSLEERSLAADEVDDRMGALFISNDYKMKVIFVAMQEKNGENVYQGMETLLVPQYRSLYRRILAGDGAVLYHCSAGQDRTGIATALLYDMLGVDRETILNDYHLSTEWRRPQWEMPDLDPADHPNNPMIQHYAARAKQGLRKVEPLFSKSGQSHLAQFFTYIDERYGGSEAYMKKALGLTDDEIGKLRATMLE